MNLLELLPLDLLQQNNRRNSLKSHLSQKKKMTLLKLLYKNIRSSNMGLNSASVEREA